MEVFKFGGLSTQDAPSVKRVTEIIRADRNKDLVLVFSAMGKTTRLLEKLIASAFHHYKDVEEVLTQFVDYHKNIISELGIIKDDPGADDIDSMFAEVRKRCLGAAGDDFDFFYDQVVVWGELIASRIMSLYLNKAGIPCRWIDIRSSLHTNDCFREGRVDWEKSLPMINKAFGKTDGNTAIHVTQGFIATSRNGHNITLGLDGSDYSAAIIAYCIDASRVTIWKDVEGIMNADPRYFSDTVKFESLSYTDAIELAYYGANVIHPKTIKPLQNKNIQLQVKSFLAPDKSGTVIRESSSKLLIPTFILKQSQVMLNISSVDFSFIIEENLRDIFDVFSKFNIRVNMMHNTALSFTVCIDTNDQKLPLFIDALNKQFSVTHQTGLELITIWHFDQATLHRTISNKQVLVEIHSGDVAQIIVKP
jgi:aspartate kinase